MAPASSARSCLTLDVRLPEALSAAAQSLLVSDLIKHLVYQRQQTPLPFEQLRSFIAKNKEKCSPSEDGNCDSLIAKSISGVEHLQLGERETRSTRLKKEQTSRHTKRFIAKAEEFVNDIDLLIKRVSDEIIANSSGVSCVTLIFGATPISPKEVFHVSLMPPAAADTTQEALGKAVRKASVQLFRSMLLDEALFDLTGKSLPATNIFVAIKRSAKEGIDWLMARPEFADIHRGQTTCINLLGPEPRTEVEATPIARKRISFPGNQLCDSYSPHPMELCTPFVPKTLRKQCETPWRPICVDMVETPCVKSSVTPWKGHCSDIYDVCTPLFDRKMSVASPEVPYEWFVSVSPIRGLKKNIFEMFAELQPALKLDQKKLSGHVVTIVEDEDQLGTFLLHNFLSSTLRSDSSVIFLGLSQTFGFYHTVLKKSGVNMVKAKEAGQLVFVDLLRDVSEAYCNEGFARNFLGSATSRITEEKVALSQIRPGKPLVIIIDKLSVLMALGLDRNDVESFYDGLLPPSSAEDCSLVVLTSRSPLAKDHKQLAVHLMLTSDLSIAVTPLRSGRSTTVTGNLCFEWTRTGESGSFQYRLEDKVVKVFAFGTCDAVL